MNLTLGTLCIAISNAADEARRLARALSFERFAESEIRQDNRAPSESSCATSEFFCQYANWRRAVAADWREMERRLRGHQRYIADLITGFIEGWRATHPLKEWKSGSEFGSVWERSDGNSAFPVGERTTDQDWCVVGWHYDTAGSAETYAKRSDLPEGFLAFVETRQKRGSRSFAENVWEWLYHSLPQAM